jgi:hypothetical protein
MILLSRARSRPARSIRDVGARAFGIRASDDGRQRAAYR